MKFRALIAGLALMLAVVPCASVGRAATAPVVRASLVLDWYPNSDHGGLFVAIERGLFRRHHVDMQAYVPSDTSAQITLVAAGKADFGISYETDLLAARAQHVPVTSVMCIMQHPLNTVMTLKSSRIVRPRQLVGKTIGMAGSPSDKPIVAALMRHDGASITRATMVNVGYSLLSALLTRKVDAVVGVYWTWEAIQAEMKGYPVNIMRVERWGVPNYCELVLVASEKTARTRPALVRNTVAALQEGYAFAAANPEAAWRALHARDRSLNRRLVIASLRLLRPIVTDASTIGYQDGRQWRRYEAWLAGNHLISRSVDVSQAFTNRFLESGVR